MSENTWGFDPKRQARMNKLDECGHINSIFESYHRLQQLGWKEPAYSTRLEGQLECLEMGSTGIHACVYQGEWPTGSWWIVGEGDLCPTRPYLVRQKVTTK